MEYKKWARENLYYIYKCICINGCIIFVYFAKKKILFSILHTYFYKTPTSVCLFYTLFYLNNMFPPFFNYFTPAHGPPTLTHTPTTFSLKTFPFFFSFFFFLFSPFSFFSSFFFFFFIILSIHISLYLPNSLNQSSSIYCPHQLNPVKGRGSNQYQNKTHTFYHQFQQTHKIPQV